MTKRSARTAAAESLLTGGARPVDVADHLGVSRQRASAIARAVGIKAPRGRRADPNGMRAAYKRLCELAREAGMTPAGYLDAAQEALAAR